MIAVAVCLDQFRWREGGLKPLIMIVLIVAGALLCYQAVTFYFRMLFRAEHFASQAVCDACKTYAALEVLSGSAPDAAADSDWLKVQCKKCGHDWTITTQTQQTSAGETF